MFGFIRINQGQGHPLLTPQRITDAKELRTVLDGTRQQVLDEYKDLSGRGLHWAQRVVEKLRFTYPIAVVTGTFRTDRPAPTSGFPEDPLLQLHYWVKMGSYFLDGTADQFQAYCDEPLAPLIYDNPENMPRHQPF